METSSKANSVASSTMVEAAGATVIVPRFALSADPARAIVRMLRRSMSKIKLQAELQVSRL